ncbi:UNVERIFIED_CONTAM: hypothetical protein Sradi_0480600 [Sesamum radiatum]|uniref:Uncharacterized protein n=1 Tax=Sesamum radiatum TaxID=300843 RepID=A0AAW2W784_SESRA
MGKIGGGRKGIPTSYPSKDPYFVSLDNKGSSHMRTMEPNPAPQLMPALRSDMAERILLQPYKGRIPNLCFMDRCAKKILGFQALAARLVRFMSRRHSWFTNIVWLKKK